MIKKQKTLIIIVACVFAVLLLAYIFVVSPLIKTDDTTNEPPELIEGEALGTGNSILMFDAIERENLQKITVSNSYGGFAFYYDKTDDQFYIENNKNAPYSKDAFSLLVVAAGYPSVMQRVMEKCDNFEEYGLTDSTTYYEVESRDGIKHRVYLGNLIPTQAGYYAKLDGRDTLYIVSSSSMNAITIPVTSYVTPMLVIPASQSDYYTIKDFSIAKKGKMFVEITSKTEKAKDSAGNDYEEFIGYEMLYPEGGYSVEKDNYDTLLQGFQEFYGEYVVEMSENFDDATLEKYGLKEPEYEIFFEYQGIKNSIVISAKQEDGTYYAYSLLFNLICSVNSETFDFLEWDILDFIDKPIFQYSITDIANITVEADGINETFILESNEKTNGSSSNDTLKVKMKSNGKYIEDPKNFRYFYMSLLNINMITLSDVDSPEGLQKIATLVVNTKAGKRLEYCFYPYTVSGRRCLYTLNGSGEFYVLRDSIDKMISDAKKLVAGEKIDYQAKD